MNFQITAAVVTFLSIPSEIFDFIPTCFNTSRKGKKEEKINVLLQIVIMSSCCVTSNSNQLVIKTFKLLSLQGHKVSVITVLICKLEKV